MKVLKIVIAVLSIALIGNLFLKDSVTIEREISINSAPNTVFMKLANLHEWKNWDYLHQIDPKVKNRYEGPKFGLKAKKIWESNTSTGSMVIDSMSLNKYLNYNLQFSKPLSIDIKGNFNLSQDKATTLLTWSNTLYLPFHKRFIGLFAEKMMGKAFDQGLNKLKDLCESNTNKYHILMYDKAPYWVRSKEINCAIADIGMELERGFQGLLTDLYSSNTMMFGKPICYYHGFYGDSAMIEAALPVSQGTLMANKNFDKSRVLKATYVGPYDETQEAYYALDSFVEKHGLEKEDSHYQIFLTDPAIEPNPNKWVTEIYYIIKD